jgi:hypothetical protein
MSLSATMRMAFINQSNLRNDIEVFSFRRHRKALEAVV